jgi:hypothetical protein
MELYEFSDGVFCISGTDRSVSFREVAKMSYMGPGLPPNMGVGLDGVGAYGGAYSF